MRLFWDDYAADGTFEALTEEYYYPVENLGLPHLSKVTKTTGDQTAEIWGVGWPTAKSFDAVVLWGHDLDGTESNLKLVADNTDLSSPAYSLALTRTDDVLVVWLGASQSYKKVGISYTKANATDVRQAGRLLVGNYYDCAKNPMKPKHSWDDPSPISRAPGGEIYSDEEQPLRTLKLGFKLAPESQKQEFDALFASRKTTRPFVISLDHASHPTDPQWLQYVVNRKEPFADYKIWNTAAPKYDLGLDLVEAR